MRAADDFAVIRARLTGLERERQWAAHRDEGAIQDELDRMDFRAVQRAKEEMKARIIGRNRLG
jgi:hypothetical protein